MVAIKVIVNKLFYKSYDDPLKKKKNRKLWWNFQEKKNYGSIKTNTIKKITD